MNLSESRLSEPYGEKLLLQCRVIVDPSDSVAYAAAFVWILRGGAEKAAFVWIDWIDVTGVCKTM